MKLARDQRYTVDASDISSDVRFHDFQNVEHICQVKDYSRTGLSFYLEDGSLLLKIGDMIADLRLYSSNKLVHTSPSTINHIQDEDQAGKVISCIGCSFETPMDVYNIVKMEKITRLQNDFMDFVQSMAIEENLDPAFVNLTSNLQFILDRYREKLYQEMDTISQEDINLQGNLIDTLKELAFDALFYELNLYYDHFSSIVNNFTDPKLSFIHRKFFQTRLSEFFSQSKLCHRGFTKPLGYAGDYEMMNIIYRNTFEGDNLFAQVMSKIDCEGSAARAVRNRRSYLYKKLRELILNTKHGHSIKIMSVACGPAVEFTDLLSSIEGKDLPLSIEYIALDQDTKALQDARTRIEPHIKDNSTIRVHFEEDNIKRLIVDRDNNKDLYKGLDFLYSAGLFDYLSDRASSRLIHKLYSFLKPGGLMIIGNFGPYNPQRFIMEFGSEWFLVYRSEGHLKSLASDLPGNPLLGIEKEPEGVNLFLTIVKP